MTVYIVLEIKFNQTRPVAVYHDEGLATAHAEALGTAHDGDPAGRVKSLELR